MEITKAREDRELSEKNVLVSLLMLIYRQFRLLLILYVIVLGICLINMDTTGFT